MSLLTTIRSRLEPFGDVRVRTAACNDHIFVLQLEDGRTGAAMHFASGSTSDPWEQWEKSLEGMRARDLLVHLGGSHPLRASAGVACANALAAAFPGPRAGHMLDVMELREDDVFGMVGNFMPLVDRIRNRVRKLLIFETIEQPTEDGLLPARDEPRLLPECSVVLVTGTTLVNGTLEELLSWCRRARSVVLAGPSTILLPEAYAGTPITWLAGSRIAQPETVLERVRRGETFRDLRAFFEKVVVPVPAS